MQAHDWWMLASFVMLAPYGVLLFLGLFGRRWAIWAACAVFALALTMATHADSLREAARAAKVERADMTITGPDGTQYRLVPVEEAK